MMAISLRSGTPGVRLGLALALSLVLHVAVLLPRANAPRAAKSSAPAPALDVSFAAPVLATQPPEEAKSSETVQAALLQPAPTAATPSPQTSPTAARPTEAPRPLRGRALSAAMAALTREEFYPRAAIESGLEGRVVLLLNLSAAGTVTAVEIADSSGHAILDAAALAAAGRIGALPGGARQVLLPVEFRLE